MPHVRSFVRFLKQSHRQLLATLDIPSRAIYQRCVAGSEFARKGANPKPSSPFPVQLHLRIFRSACSPSPSPLLFTDSSISPRLHLPHSLLPPFPNFAPLHSPFASFSPPPPPQPSPLPYLFRFPRLPPLPAPLAPFRRSLGPRSYTYTSNGFAASLTSAEARRLKLHPAVAAVEEDEYLPALTSSTHLRDPDTFPRLPEAEKGGQVGGQAGSVRRRKLMTDSPGFLRLPGSLWAANGGQDNAGEGVIVGVIDTGVWPEHPSFANTVTIQPLRPYPPPVVRKKPGDSGLPRVAVPIGAQYSSRPTFPSSPSFLPLSFLQPSNPYGPVQRRWRGKCQANRDFPQSLCSRKLIGARFFAAGVRKSSAGVNKEKDFLSPRDGDGHGTWCASPAAGNANVPLTLSPTRTLGTISGVAPRARLATYKALWVTPGGEAGSAGNANVPLTLSPTRTLGTISGVAPRARLATYKALWVTPGGEAGAFQSGIRAARSSRQRQRPSHPPCIQNARHHLRSGAPAAAGNANVPLTPSPTRTLGTISGVAPRARLATYKALWVTPGGEAGAFQSDIRAAVDAAVSDGVDVLSCSFGGAISRYFNDLPYLQALKAGVLIAFAAGNSGASHTTPSHRQILLGLLLLAKAGVFIAFAAGNSGAPSKGQMLGTLSNTASFYLTVGASTIGREYQANLTLGNGVHLTGLAAGLSPIYPSPTLPPAPPPFTPHQHQSHSGQRSAAARGAGLSPIAHSIFPISPTLSPALHTIPTPTSTIGREYQANLTLGNGVQLTGLGLHQFPSCFLYTPSPTRPPTSTIGREYQANLTLGNGVQLAGLGFHQSPSCFLSPLPHVPPLPCHQHHRSTIGREYQTNLTLGNGVQLTGLGFGSAGNAQDLPLLLSSAAVHPLGTLSLVRGFGSAGNARDLPLLLSSAAVHPLGTLSLVRAGMLGTGRRADVGLTLEGDGQRHRQRAGPASPALCFTIIGDSAPGVWWEGEGNVCGGMAGGCIAESYAGARVFRLKPGQV
ncbi:unnamed protein product [Closterium sp. Naga37s-1]|nr:unnamed protein product [Closterium sp. Naga37s-1]